MKTTQLITLMAMTGLLACGALAQDAKPTSPERPAAGAGGQGGGARMREQAQRLEQDLNLTPEQKTKMQEARRQQSEKARALREDTTLTQEQRQEKMRALREANQKSMKEILTPEQFEKWSKAQAEMQGRRGGPGGPGGAGGRGGPGGGGAPAPEKK